MLFFLISILGILSFKNSEKLNFLIIYLLLLSIILEIFHLIIPERGFEFSDLFGNLVGVFIAIIINYFYGKYENFEK